MVKTNNLKIARKAAGLTQAEVSKAIGISQNGYSYWENGKAKIDNESLTKLAQLFGTTTDYLLAIDKTKPATSESSGFRVKYETLNETNQALVDSLIDQLLKGQSDP